LKIYPQISLYPEFYGPLLTPEVEIGGVRAENALPCLIASIDPEMNFSSQVQIKVKLCTVTPALAILEHRTCIMIMISKWLHF